MDSRSSVPSSLSHQFITIDRGDPKFESYVSGKFSKRQRALPVRSLNPGREKQLLTFQISSFEQITRPHFGIVLLYLFRWSWVSLVLAPVMVLALYLESQSISFGLRDLLSVVTSLLFAFGGAFMMDDYYDHMSGMDISSRHRGSQVIQNGWMTARQVQLFSYGSLFLALILGTPLLLEKGELLWLPVALAAAAILGYSYKGRGFKYQGWGDFWLFLCFGPILMLALQKLFINAYHLELLAMSVPLGWATVLVLQSRQFSNIMYDESVGKKTFVARLGFDRAHRFIKTSLSVCLLIFLGLYMFFHPFYHWGWAAGVICVVVVAMRRLHRIHSPLSSSMANLYRLFLFVQISMMVAMCLPYLISILGRWL